MEIKKIKEKIEKGAKIYYAPFWEERYDGSLVSGETCLYFLTPESKPNFNLTIKENIELGLIKEIPKDSISIVYRYTKRKGRGSWYYYRGEGVVFSDLPFILYVRHRGYTGERNDDRDELYEAQEIKTAEEFLNLLR